MSEALLSTRGLRITAGEKTLCAGLDLDLAAGQFWCVLGRNGAGKSTLLHTLAGLQPPAAGAIRLAGRELREIPAQQLARRRGLLLQQQFDAFSSTALDTVLAGRHPYQSGPGWDDEQDEALARAALAGVDLAAYAARDVVSLSGGERQRVALAALLAQDPDLLLLDEPTAQQDAAAQLLVMGLLRDVVRGANASASTMRPSKAAMAACHDINLVARFATHVLVLAPGRHWAGPMEEVLTPAILEQAFDCRFEIMQTRHGWMFAPLA